jgi:N6-adenosine-specific RNA methylase IME4
VPAQSGEIQPINIGGFLLTTTGLEVEGRPSFENYEGALRFAKHVVRVSGFWLGDLLAYGDKREDWRERLSQAHDVTGLSEKTLQNVRAVARAIPRSRRRDDLEFSIQSEVASLEPEEQEEWLAKAKDEGWTQRELRVNIRASQRRRVIEGQAVLEGLYRVVLADPPWHYGDSGPVKGTAYGKAERHYPSMTMEELSRLSVAAHCLPNAVLFCWVTAPMLLENPGPREVIESWGFTPKSGMVWHKARHNFGHYVSVRHEHVIIATRGSCLPDRATPMVDSVFTSEKAPQQLEHSEKPEELRKFIERMYDGPYLELFARRQTAGWTCMGNDARLWTQEG